MMINCEVIILEQPRIPVEVLPEAVFPPPSMGLATAVPAGSHSPQLVRLSGDVSPQTFMVFNRRSRFPQNLDGCVLWLNVYSNQDCADRVFSIVGSSDEPSSGVVSFTPNIRQLNKPGQYYYDIQLKNIDGSSTTLICDSLNIV